MDIKLLIKGTRRTLVVQSVQCGKVRLRFGPKDESDSSSNSREDNVCNEALHVVGLHGSGDKVSLFLDVVRENF